MARSWTPSQEDAMRLTDKTLLVSAAAGSGKTSVLTERIIRRLLDPEHPADLSRMLVVTFTRAAAAELKSRIGAALSAAMEAHPDDPRLPRQMLLLGSAEISTIDAFFQKIVKKHFEQLHLPASFRMADPAELLPICNEILGSVLEEFYRRGCVGENKDAMTRIRSNRFAKNLDHLMSNRSDGKLNETLLSFYEQFHSYADGIDLLRQTAEDLRTALDGEFTQSRIGTSLVAFLTEEFTYYQTVLEDFAGEILSDPEQKQICGAMLESDIDYCNRVLTTLSDGAWEDIDLAVRGFIPGRFSSSKNKAAATKNYQAWRSDVLRPELKERIAALERTPPAILPAQMEATASLFETLYELYSEYERRLLTEKTERGILGFEDVRRALSTLLASPDGAPTALADSLAASYDEVYIDEYQDVDELQDRIFALLGRGHRFMVGDIKQSIYGFRGSEPTIFSGYRRRMPLYDRTGDGTAPEYCIFMSENFRCNRPIIDFANQVCAFLFTACEDTIGYRAEDDLSCSKPREEDAPRPAPVVLRTFEPKPRTQTAVAEEDEEELGEETLYLIDEIHRLLREGRLDSGARIEPQQVAVLVRTRKTSLAIARALNDAGIPALSDTPSNPLEDPLTMDTINLLRAIDNPYRDLPLSEALLSPLCGFTLEELDDVRRAAPEEKALFDAMQSYAASPREPALGKRIAEWIARLDRWQEEASVLSADRFLRRFLREECILPYAKEPSLLNLYDRARAYQKNAFCGLFGFLETFVKQASSNQASMDGLKQESSAVSVMTIHHSKGLEYPVVFVAGCGARRSAEEKKASVLFHRRVGGAAKLFDPVLGEVERNLLQEECARVILEEEAAEAIRVLYVALTRARERLYVTGTVSKNRDAAIRYIHPSRPRSVLSAGCDMYRILAALENAPHRPGLAVDRQHFPWGTYRESREEVFREESSTPPPVAAPLPEDTATLRYRRILERKESFTYPLSYLQGIPTKVAASRLRPRDTEDTEDRSTEELLAMMNAPPLPFDSLLLDRQTPSAAEVGTATHAFLQFCDFHALKEHGIDRELERMLREGFLNETSATILRRDLLERFCRSDLFAMLLNAREVAREQKFATTLPLSVLSSHPDALADREHTLFVQGSIDLVITTKDGRRILVDYKTDRITEKERRDPSLLTARLGQEYGNQLACYSIAIRALYGTPPDRIFIYSLPLGELLEISPPSLTAESIAFQ